MEPDDAASTAADIEDEAGLWFSFADYEAKAADERVELRRRAVRRERRYRDYSRGN